MAVGPFQMISIEPCTYCLVFPPSIAAVHLWFHTSIFKPAEPQPIGLLALQADSYEVEAIIQIKKRGTHSKVKRVGYHPSYNQ